MHDVQTTEAFLAQAQKEGEPSEIAEWERYVQDAKQVHIQKQTQAADSVKGNMQLHQLQDELDKMVDAVDQLNPEEVAGVKEANQKIANLHVQAEKAKKVRERLEQEKTRSV